jgi:predicted MFS family arabinose efflux permease
VQRPEGSPQAAARLALVLLTLAYALNFLDRQILGILLVPIQKEFGVSDTAMGALAGLCFALLFTLAGLPIAHWADRGTRRDILALGLLVWSCMTLLCGQARVFAQLALARVGVGLGEAACLPAAHSLISDLYPRERRTGALALFSSGFHLGTLCAFALGGWFAERHGWRAAFLAAGLPGIALALVVRLALREPPRVDAARAPAGASLREGLLELLGNRRFLLLAGAASCTSIVGYGYMLWSPTFLARVHGMPTGEIGLWLGLVCGLGGAAGTLGCGALAQRCARRSPRWQLGVPAIALALSIVFYAGCVLSPGRERALASLLLAQVCAASWFGPVFAAVQDSVAPQRRALAAALLLALLTLLGLGLGPTLVGAGNDWFRAALGERAIVRSLLLLLVFELLAVGCLVRAALSTSARTRAPS